jgi:hypothetical protein
MAALKSSHGGADGWVRAREQVRLQRWWRDWLAVNGQNAPKRKWWSVYLLWKEFGSSMPVAEAWGLGLLARTEGGAGRAAALALPPPRCAPDGASL